MWEIIVALVLVRFDAHQHVVDVQVLDDSITLYDCLNDRDDAQQHAQPGVVYECSLEQTT
jgi:hypothetical protein